MTDQRILIAGGGPVGMLCAWLLGRQGIAVRLFDNNRELQADPRAATTHPATLDLLSEDGLDADMARVGLTAPIFQFWDRPSQQLVAQFDYAVLKNDTRHPFVVQCEQFKTAKLILDRLQRFPNVEVMFDHEVVDLAQSVDAVTVQVREPSGAIARHSGTYLIGADGGRSAVRRRSEINFEGPHRRDRIRPGAIDRQQEAAGSARSTRARAQSRRAPRDGSRPRTGPAIPVAHLDDREPAPGGGA
jgi:3-(3-hydroxy-phenyl)propionate hydroxylase